MWPLRQVAFAALAVAVVFLAAAPAAASTCICQGSFVDNARQADLVVRATPTELVGIWPGAAPRYVKLSVTAVFKGDPGDGVVVVEGDDGVSLRRYASDLPPGSEWLLALRLDRVQSNGGRRSVVYTNSVCGSTALRVAQGRVSALGCEEPENGKPVGEVVERLKKALAEDPGREPTAVPTPSP